MHNLLKRLVIMTIFLLFTLSAASAFSTPITQEAFKAGAESVQQGVVLQEKGFFERAFDVIKSIKSFLGLMEEKKVSVSAKVVLPIVGLPEVVSPEVVKVEPTEKSVIAAVVQAKIIDADSPVMMPSQPLAIENENMSSPNIQAAIPGVPPLMVEKPIVPPAMPSINGKVISSEEGAIRAKEDVENAKIVMKVVGEKPVNTIVVEKVQPMEKPNVSETASVSTSLSGASVSSSSVSSGITVSSGVISAAQAPKMPSVTTTNTGTFSNIEVGSLEPKIEISEQVLARVELREVDETPTSREETDEQVTARDDSDASADDVDAIRRKVVTKGTIAENRLSVATKDTIITLDGNILRIERAGDTDEITVINLMREQDVKKVLIDRGDLVFVTKFKIYRIDDILGDIGLRVIAEDVTPDFSGESRYEIVDAVVRNGKIFTLVGTLSGVKLLVRDSVSDRLSVTEIASGRIKNGSISPLYNGDLIVGVNANTTYVDVEDGVVTTIGNTPTGLVSVFDGMDFDSGLRTTDAITRDGGIFRLNLDGVNPRWEPTGRKINSNVIDVTKFGNIFNVVTDNGVLFYDQYWELLYEWLCNGPLYMLNFNILQTNYAEQLQGVLQNLNTFEQLSTEQIRDIKEVDEDRILDPSGPVEVDQNLLRYDPSVTINPGEVSKNRVLTTGLKTVVDKNRILTTEIDQDKLRITSDSLRQLSTLREFGNRLYVGDRMVITGYDKFKKAGGNCYGKDGPEETTTETEPETAAQTVTQTASPMVEVVVEESECDHITLKITGAFEEAVWAINDEYEAAGSEVEQVFSDLVPGGEYEIEVTIDSKFKANIMVVIEDSENCNAIVFNDEDGIGETVFQIGDPEKDASENTKTTATAPTHSLFAKGGGCSLVEDSPLTKGSLLFFAILLISPFVIIPARARSKRK